MNESKGFPVSRRLGRRVLLAMEGAVRRAGVAQAFLDRGASVIEVDDGLGLLEMLGSQLGGGELRAYPDMVVLDARLPLMDGLDALGLVRSFDRRLPAVLVVAQEDDDARRQAPEMGAAVVDRGLEAPQLVDGVLRTVRPLTGRAARSLQESSG